MKVFRILFVALVVLSLVFVACEEGDDGPTLNPPKSGSSTSIKGTSSSIPSNPTDVPSESEKPSDSEDPSESEEPTEIAAPDATHYVIYKVEFTGLPTNYRGNKAVLSGTGIGGWVGWDAATACASGTIDSTGKLVMYINKKIVDGNCNDGEADGKFAEITNVNVTGGLLELPWNKDFECAKCGDGTPWGTNGSYPTNHAAHYGAYEAYDEDADTGCKKGHTTQTAPPAIVDPWSWCDTCWGGAAFSGEMYKFVNQTGKYDNAVLTLPGLNKVWNIIVDAAADLSGDDDSAKQDGTGQPFEGGWKWEIVENK